MSSFHIIVIIIIIIINIITNQWRNVGIYDGNRNNCWATTEFLDTQNFKRNGLFLWTKIAPLAARPFASKGEDVPSFFCYSAVTRDNK